MRCIPRGAVCLAVSIGAHALVLPVLAWTDWSARSAVGSSGRSLSSVVELERVPAQTVPGEVRPVTSQRLPTPRRPVTRRGLDLRSRVSSGARGAGPRTRDQVEPAGVTPSPAEGTPAALPAPSGLLRMRSRLELAPSLEALAELPRRAHPAQADPLSGRSASGSATSSAATRAALAERVRRLLATDLAQHHARSGRVSPRLFEVARRADQLFTVDWELVRGDRAHLGSIKRGLASFVYGIWDGWQKALGAQSRSHREARGAVEAPQRLEAYAAAAEAAAERADELRATYCIETDGREVRLTLASRSGRRPFDRIAERALRTALRLEPEGSPPLPAACYRFTARFHRVPPLPYVGCSFDEVLLKAACFYPLKRILRTNVELVSAAPSTE
ncbi:MAG: hypothetical protein IT371_23290 [Deltaproteobacteria bacterium]|nr:hypothetical protein [Deltaproteobacteria bacterium]